MQRLIYISSLILSLLVAWTAPTVANSRILLRGQLNDAQQAPINGDLILTFTLLHGCGESERRLDRTANRDL